MDGRERNRRIEVKWNRMKWNGVEGIRGGGWRVNARIGPGRRLLTWMDGSMDQWIIQWQNEVTKEIRRRKERGWNNNATTTAAQDGFLGPFGVVVEGRPHIRTTTNAASRKSHLFCKHCQTTMHTTWCKARAFWSFLAICKYQSQDEKGSQVFAILCLRTPCVWCLWATGPMNWQWLDGVFARAFWLRWP